MLNDVKSIKPIWYDLIEKHFILNKKIIQFCICEIVLFTLLFFAYMGNNCVYQTPLLEYYDALNL